jgi:hypothetical protein
MKELSNWGRWGADDELGAANLITPAKRKHGFRRCHPTLHGPLEAARRERTVGEGYRFEPYFDSDFPHSRDQFISAAATNWAVIGLAPRGKVNGVIARYPHGLRRSLVG